MKYVKKHSLRRQMVVTFVSALLILITLILFVNTSFLENYYVMHKKRDLTTLYYAIDEQVSAGNMDNENICEKLDRQAEKKNISVMIIQPDGNIGYTTYADPQAAFHGPLYVKLLSHIYGQNQDSGKILKETDTYQIYQSTDSLTKVEYLEMWGSVADGSIFVMRSPMESMRDSARLANKFLIYLGLVAVVIGGALVWINSNSISKPIKELAELSKRMANLDFEARYESGGQNEISILGNNFNIMSDKLEKTISELKCANNKLQKDIERKEQLDEMRREFLGNVSHELKTPIALIQGYAEGLKEGVSDDPESRAFYCDVIIDEALKMNTMVKNLLALNQLEFGNEKLEFERFDIAGVIKGVLSSCDLLVKQAGAEAKYIGDDHIYVWGDEFKAEQVVRNYLTNAINHVENEKRIEIRAVLRDNNLVRVTVFNSGNPIPEEDIERLWDKFYKVDKSHTREYGGHGIGLSIVKAIMKSFNRDFGVVNYDNGVEFWFELDAGKE